MQLQTTTTHARVGYEGGTLKSPMNKKEEVFASMPSTQNLLKELSAATVRSALKTIQT